MRKLKDVVRLKFGCNLTHRQIAKSLNISPSTVSKLVNDFVNKKLSWPIDEAITNDDLEIMVYGEHKSQIKKNFVEPDWSACYQELQKKNVTKHILWEEYSNSNVGNAYSYSQFCTKFRQWSKSKDISMRQVHIAGEKLFVDYAGTQIDVYCAIENKVKKANIFVACLGASNYTYVEATWSQSKMDWINSHVNAFNYFDGVPQIVVPDNLKSAVIKPSYYDPDINPTYHQLSCHYDFAILPARVRKPKDKAKVENAVKVVGFEILAKIRNQEFNSLQQLNESIKKLLDEMNNKPFQKLPGSRRSQFLQIDKPALKPLPANKYHYTEVLFKIVARDYHFVLAGHAYSVPFKYANKKIEIHISKNLVTAFYKGKQIAVHVYNHTKGSNTTLSEHMPREHQEYASQNPEIVKSKAQKIGPYTLKVVESVLSQKENVFTNIRACMSILKLCKKYGDNRLEKACKRAYYIQAPTPKSINSILEKGLDNLVLEENTLENKSHQSSHENIRGSQYYQ